MAEERVIFMQDRDGVLRRWTPNHPALHPSVLRLRRAASTVEQHLEHGRVTATAQAALAEALAALEAESR